LRFKDEVTTVSTGTEKIVIAGNRAAVPCAHHYERADANIPATAVADLQCKCTVPTVRPGRDSGGIENGSMVRD
jgi:hypothetical protein